MNLRLRYRWMLFRYRWQKAYEHLGPFWMILAISGIFQPMVSPIYYSLGWIPYENVFLGLVLTMALLFSFLTLFGFISVDVLRFQDREHTVVVERNPYPQGKLAPKEMVFLKDIWIPHFTHLGEHERVEWLKDCIEKEWLMEFEKWRKEKSSS